MTTTGSGHVNASAAVQQINDPANQGSVAAGHAKELLHRVDAGTNVHQVNADLVGRNVGIADASGLQAPNN